MQRLPSPTATVLPTQPWAEGCAGGLAVRSSLQAELGGLTNFQGLVNRRRGDGEAEKAGKPKYLYLPQTERNVLLLCAGVEKL